MFKKHICHDMNSFNYEIRFIVQNMIYPENCSMCTSKQKCILVLLGGVLYKY